MQYNHLLLKEKREGKKDVKKGLREEKEKENARQGRSRKPCVEKTGITASAVPEAAISTYTCSLDSVLVR